MLRDRGREREMLAYSPSGAPGHSQMKQNLCHSSQSTSSLTEACFFKKTPRFSTVAHTIMRVWSEPVQGVQHPVLKWIDPKWDQQAKSSLFRDIFHKQIKTFLWKQGTPHCMCTCMGVHFYTDKRVYDDKHMVSVQACKGKKELCSFMWSHATVINITSISVQQHAAQWWFTILIVTYIIIVLGLNSSQSTWKEYKPVANKYMNMINMGTMLCAPNSIRK